MTLTMALRRACLAALAMMVAAPLAANAPASASVSGEDSPSLVARPAFSPNGDGVADRLLVRYELSKSSPVTMTVRTWPKTKVLLTRRLPRQAAGTYHWRWDGRLADGHVARNGIYEITLTTLHGRSSDVTRVDRRFEAAIAAAYPRDTDHAAARAYPRSDVVRDALPLVLDGETDGYERAFVKITNRAGDVVHRRRLTARDWSRGTIAWEARDTSGRPLAPGRYRAAVVGADRLGNTGQGTPLRIWVSADKLVWREETRSVRAEDSQKVFSTSKYQKDDYDTWLCGTVEPIEHLPGALRHHAGACDAFQGMVAWAESHHHVAVPEAVRGLESFRVAFTGAPVTAGEADLGHLVADANGMEVLWGQVTGDVESSSGAQTSWVGASHLGRGGAYWSFWTEGDDVFDVASFTLDLRYLAPAS